MNAQKTCMSFPLEDMQGKFTKEVHEVPVFEYMMCSNNINPRLGIYVNVVVVVKESM